MHLSPCDYCNLTFFVNTVLSLMFTMDAAALLDDMEDASTA